MLEMTPQEIFDYKRKWFPGHEVIVHSDLRDHARDWCKTRLEKHEYGISWTHPYAITYRFESIRVAQNFEHEFIDWVNKGID